MATHTASSQRVVLAVDIGATKIAVGLVDGNGKIAFEARAPSPRLAEPSLALIGELGDKARAQAQAAGHVIVAAGIACGGPLDLAKGLVLSPPNLPDWDKVPVTGIIAERFGLAAFLQNDAAAGAIATALWDNPDRVADVTYITVSSGLGCGVITDGALYVGHSGNGSELGHIPLIHDGRPCPCGLAGCFEAYVSGTSIGRRYSEMMQGSFTARDVSEAAGRGEAPATAFWHESMLMLSRAIRAAADIFDPALIAVGGGVTEADDALFAPAFTFAGKGMAAGVGKSFVARKTGFGRASGVAGAASVAWNELADNGEYRVRTRPC